jgi:hypothetical protein
MAEIFLNLGNPYATHTILAHRALQTPPLNKSLATKVRTSKQKKTLANSYIDQIQNTTFQKKKPLHNKKKSTIEINL